MSRIRLRNINPTGSFSLTGSLTVQGNELVTGSLTVLSGITGSLHGTSSWAVTASHALNIPNNLNITASNILVNNNLVVLGTASFGYTKTTTGSAVIIGDEFIILNADTPTLPYAGIVVYDTGSNSTASLEWNGNNDYWIAVEETGQSAGFLTGPSGSKGSEVFPSLNKVIKGTGNNTVVDTNITDTGTKVSISTPLDVTGSVSLTNGAFYQDGVNLVDISLAYAIALG